MRIQFKVFKTPLRQCAHYLIKRYYQICCGTESFRVFLSTNRAWFHCHPFSRTGLQCACLSCDGFRSCAVRFLIFSLNVMWFVNADNLPSPLPWMAVVACLWAVGPFSCFPPSENQHWVWPWLIQAQWSKADKYVQSLTGQRHDRAQTEGQELQPWTAVSTLLAVVSTM